MSSLTFKKEGFQQPQQTPDVDERGSARPGSMRCETVRELRHPRE
jgi:hypothetical protein